MTKAVSADRKELSVEQALERIETLVREVESGKLSLEETIARFEEGSSLAKICREKLESAERKILTILRENGEPSALSPLEPDTQ